MMYMKSNILKFLSSPVTCLLLMIVYACGLAAATFIEKQLGTETAKGWVYYSPIFIFWQFLMVVNFVAMTWKYQLISRKRWGALLTHLAFIVRLGGAMCSHVFSEEGQKQCREMLAFYKENARIMSEALAKKGIKFYGGTHSPYIWMQCPNGMGSWEFFDYLLEKLAVVGTPGAGFGSMGEGYFRLTAFGSRENTIEAMERIEKGL